MKYRFQSAASGDSEPVRVDRENRVIYGVSIMQEGEALGHGVLIDSTMNQQAVDAINGSPNGMKSRFTHPGMCADGLGKQLGRIKNARLQADKAVGDLYLSKFAANAPDGDLATYVMDMAEESPQDFGLSIAFDGNAVWKMADGTEIKVDDPSLANDDDGFDKPDDATTDMPFARITKMRAVDAVDEPAANRDGLFAKAFASTSSADAAQAFAQLDAMRERMGLSADRVHAFLTNYLAARTPAPHHKPIKDSIMSLDATKLAALYDKHPGHTKIISDAFRAGTDEAGIVALIGAAERSQLAAENTAVKAELAAAQTKHTTELAALSTKLADLESRYGKLSALAAGGKTDPGADPAGGAEKPMNDDSLKAEWAALPKAKQIEFCGSFDAYAFARQHPQIVAPSHTEHAATGV